MTRIEVQRISAGQTRPLRRAVLRPDQPPEASVYPGDANADTLHAGAYVDGTLVGVATVSREPPDPAFLDRVTRPDSAWRLRGMAVRPEHQGRGLGAGLLALCLDHARSQGGEVLWCNARATAERFYASHGLARWSELFELPGIGAHYVMGISLAT